MSENRRYYFVAEPVDSSALRSSFVTANPPLAARKLYRRIEILANTLTGEDVRLFPLEKGDFRVGFVSTERFAREVMELRGFKCLLNGVCRDDDDKVSELVQEATGNWGGAIKCPPRLKIIS